MSTDTLALALARKYKGAVIGSAYFGKPRPGDIDVLLSVPGPEIGGVERQLLDAGFRRNEPDPATTDVNVIAAYSAGCFDIQLATPAGYAVKRWALGEIKRKRLHVGRSKPELYSLYNQMYSEYFEGR